MGDFADILEEDAARMALVNLATGDRWEALYNPEKLEETLGAAYVNQKVPGLSHPTKQFSNTESLVEKFQMVWSANGKGPKAQEELLTFRRWMMSLCYPRRASSLVEGGGPPRVLFVWPGFMSLTCVITALSFSYPKMSKAGPPVIMAIDVTAEEIRDTLLLMEDVIDVGTERTP